MSQLQLEASAPAGATSSATPAAHVTLVQRFAALPRAMQWLVLAALGLILFLVWDSFIRPWSDEFDKRASRIESNAKDIRALEEVTRELRGRDLRRVVLSLGAVAPPGNVAEVSASLNALVSDTLKKHSATNPSFSARTRGKLPKTALVTVAQGRRIDRYTIDLKFDATPQAAAAVIADLESSSLIQSIGTVRMVRDAGGKVRVQVVFEAWTLESPIGGGSSA